MLVREIDRTIEQARNSDLPKEVQEWGVALSDALARAGDHEVGLGAARERRSGSGAREFVGVSGNAWPCRRGMDLVMAGPRGCGQNAAASGGGGGVLPRQGLARPLLLPVGIAQDTCPVQVAGGSGYDLPGYAGCVVLIEPGILWIIRYYQGLTRSSIDRMITIKDARRWYEKKSGGCFCLSYSFW